MKNYFCVNSWVDNNPYLPDPIKEFEPALVQIDDNLNFNVGDQIFLGLDLFRKLHEAAKDMIKRFYGVETVTFKEIKDLIRCVNNLKYLYIMFGTGYEYKYPDDEDNEESWVKEYDKEHNDSDLTIEEEEKNFKFLKEDLYNYVIIRVFNVVYDLEKDMRVFELEIDKITY